MHSGFPSPFFSTPQSSPMSPQFSLFLWDLDDELSEEFLHPLFSKYGVISSLKLAQDSYLGLYGVVTYSSARDAEKARAALNQNLILKKQISVGIYRNPESTPENCTVFLENLSKELTFTDIDKELGQFGRVLVSNVSTDGETGFGYVEFETDSEAEDCLAQDGEIFINGNPINLVRAKDSLLTTFYVKNLPKSTNGKSLQQYKRFLEDDLRNKIGKISISSFVLRRKEASGSGLMAVISFESKTDAEKASANLLSSTPAYEIVWANKLGTRIQNLRKIACKKAVSNNILLTPPTPPPTQTNLYTKGLKRQVGSKDLEKALSSFGRLISCRVIDSPDPRVPTRQGFIEYELPIEAQRALDQAKDKADVKALFVNSKPYFAWHFNKKGTWQTPGNNNIDMNMTMPPRFPPMGYGAGMGPIPMMMPFMPAPPPFMPFRPDYMGYHPMWPYPAIEMQGPNNLEVSRDFFFIGILRVIHFFFFLVGRVLLVNNKEWKKNGKKK